MSALHTRAARSIRASGVARGFSASTVIPPCVASRAPHPTRSARHAAHLRFFASASPSHDELRAGLDSTGPSRRGRPTARRALGHPSLSGRGNAPAPRTDRDHARRSMTGAERPRSDVMAIRRGSYHRAGIAPLPEALSRETSIPSQTLPATRPAPDNVQSDMRPWPRGCDTSRGTTMFTGARQYEE